MRETVDVMSCEIGYLVLHSAFSVANVASRADLRGRNRRTMLSTATLRDTPCTWLGRKFVREKDEDKNFLY